ncbi:MULTISPECIES: septal ring lytic transglycosylase RlpA family protein [unclassified Sphingopyxis]|nr:MULTISPECIES: septal ring lytic transglycosylase RlpA family protein [unclassified Sphingopyxis]ENY82238.1 rare lipoprotein A [Sphingopyxis sp. MC1]KAB2850515.1 MAG: septal ring lytic transglycosylase RlpA family protein [Sphingopyxis terrae]MBU7590368.1 septal ring lytic transglycosylase RlpA family protein [Sphingopyxis terrae]
MRRVMAMSLALMLAMPAVAQDQIGGGETEIGNGTASYYGRELAGNRTASGERFDPDQMTAAHPTLAFGSKVRVTNLSNGQSVIVRVNDRGPFGGRRVIDISQAAAKEIGMHRSGTAKVSLTLVAD